MEEAVRIRPRTRRCASPPPGMRQVWEEFQIVQKRRVLYRGDTEEEAAKWAMLRGYYVFQYRPAFK